MSNKRNGVNIVYSCDCYGCTQTVEVFARTYFEGSLRLRLKGWQAPVNIDGKWLHFDSQFCFDEFKRKRAA